MEQGREIKVPQDRVAVLIGKNGSVKKAFEKEFKVKIDISSEGLVLIKGNDSLKVWDCEKSIKAIARGFNPEIAILLKNEEYDFELISITDFAKSKNDFDRLRGRVIGREGASKELIEKKTETYIIIYGKTVGIIGKHGMIELAVKGVEMLLNGARHATVFNYLDKELRKKMNEAMM
ncbi:MAG: KH domain-containing protein [Candidatus Nanoarchaeia archaeon]|nr:KH domain-containing protein [Candidatus Nanoarchaeia archaeon]MDD5054442.1 KH domain-containing protein [Candidatus Nanoarchaeia archaeon]MDD5499409.1 KH domain-containing protein [Candidatus Nanoarchaeia archaeon]